MYTRSFGTPPSEIPEGYGGTAMNPPEHSDDGYIREDGKNPWEIEDKTECSACPKGRCERGGKGGLLSGLFGGNLPSLDSLGFEELLIIGAAAYMLFSKDGDRECGIMLLFLLFVN